MKTSSIPTNLRDRDTRFGRSRAPLLAALLVSLVAATTASAQPLYTATPIGALPDFDPSIPTPPTSTATAINGHGAIAGTSWISGGCIEIGQGVVRCEPILAHPVFWKAGLLSPLAPLTIGVQPLEYTSIPRAINEYEQVVGEYFSKQDPYLHAFIGEASFGLDGLCTELPSLIPGDSRAWDVNGLGTVVGDSDANGTVGFHAVVWRFGEAGWTVQDLGTFGGESSRALGINGLDQITGWAKHETRQSTFLYLPEAAYGLAAGMNDITPGAVSSQGNDINGSGEIVGGFGTRPLPMIWLPSPAYGLPAGVTVFQANQVAPAQLLDEIGALRLEYAQFTAINDAGLATVEASFEFPHPVYGKYSERRGMVWWQGEFTLIDKLLAPNSGWRKVTGAADVNALGEIAASGVTDDGDFLGAFLSPR